MRTRVSRAMGVGAAALLLVGVAAAPGTAATGSGSFAATCNPSSYPFATNGLAYQHASKGTLKIKQTGPSALASSVKAVSQNGNSLSVKTISNGGTAEWPDVLAGQYKVHARLSADHNCNGALPGHGNYTFKYTITYA